MNFLLMTLFQQEQRLTDYFINQSVEARLDCDLTLYRDLTTSLQHLVQTSLDDSYQLECTHELSCLNKIKQTNKMKRGRKMTPATI
jgi:hypothetical protein